MTEVHAAIDETMVRDVVVYSDSTNTTPLDITGGTVEFQVYNSPYGSLVEDLDTSASIIDAEHGKILISLETPEDGPHVYYGKVTLTESDTTESVVDEFKLTIGNR